MKHPSTRRFLFAAGFGLAACLAGCSSSSTDAGTGAQTGGSAGAAPDGGTGGTSGSGGALPDSGSGGALPDSGSGGALPDSGSAGASADGAVPDGNQDASDGGDGSVAWTYVGGAKVAAPGAANYGRIVSVNGTPYAAYEDNDQTNKLTVVKLDAGAWAPVGTAGFSTEAVDAPTLALAVDNATPYVAFRGLSSGGITVMKYSGTGWVTLGMEAFATAGAGAISLVIVAGTPYVAFVDATGVPHVMSFGGASWAEVGTIPSTASELILGTNGTTLYLAFNDSATSSLTLLQTTGSTWTSVATTTEMIGESWAGNISISNGTLFLTCLSASNEAVVMKLVGSALESVGTIGSISGGHVIEFVSGAVYNGVPYVAFDDETKDLDPEPRAATVKYWDGSAWLLYGDYPNLCDIENTVLYADQSNGHLYLTYSDCDADMTVQVR